MIMDERGGADPHTGSRKFLRGGGVLQPLITTIVHQGGCGCSPKNDFFGKIFQTKRGGGGCNLVTLPLDPPVPHHVHN